MYTGLREVVRADQPTRTMRKRIEIEQCCCCTEEPAAKTAVEVPVDQSQADWQKEKPPYFHRDIF